MTHELSARATRDVDEIGAYIRADSPQNADAVLGRLQALFEQLSDPIRPGRVAPWTRRKNIRIATTSGYHVIFNIDHTPPLVLRVIRANRDLRRVKLN